MPHLTNLDRDKLSVLSREGNEDAVFFLGQTEQTQKRNYYRGWKILADHGDADAIRRLEDERERLRSNHEQRAAMIAAGVDEGSSEAVARLEKHKEDVRRRQQNSRARKRARQSDATKKHKVAAEVVNDIDVDGLAATAASNDNCEMNNRCFVPDMCPVDDEEPLPTINHLVRIKQETEEDLLDLHVPPQQTTAGPVTQRGSHEQEIELKLRRIDAEIKQAVLEAEKATLELELFNLRKGKTGPP